MSDKGFHDYVMQELFHDYHDIASRPMFGGWGLYKDGIIFGLIADDQLYFKVDAVNRADYQNIGSQPFVYQSKNHKSTTMSYWEVPAEITDDRQALAEFVNKAVEASLRSRK